METSGGLLFLANAIILVVMAVVFLVAGRNGNSEPYWRSWALANFLLAGALVVFMLERGLPPLLVALLPNALLVMGFSVRWQAAREFGGRDVPAWLLWGPALAFCLLYCLPRIYGSYAAAYTIVNLMLASLAFVTAWEFWRDRDDRLPSRYGLVAAYGLLAASFFVRFGQGMLFGSQMGGFLPYDMLLVVHLIVAVVSTTAATGFALSIAYERKNATLRHAADHDFLTGVLNRGAFERRLRETISDETAGPFAIIMFDVDHFKQINDLHGHAAGDAALTTCASLIRDCLRRDDVLARIGGEEFAVLLPAVSAEDANNVARRIGGTLRGLEMGYNGKPFRLTLSAGVCHSDNGNRDFDCLLGMADAMLYAAKSNGRDRVEAFAA